MQLNILIDEATRANVELALGDMAHRAPQAMSAAINETVAETKTLISRKVREVLAVSKKSVDSRIRVIKATPKNLRGEVKLLYDKRPGLYSFGARQVKAGVSYKLSVQGGRKTIAHAFIAAKRGQSHLNVFIRARLQGPVRPGGNPSKGIGLVPRYPLIRLQGLSPWGAIVYRSGVLDNVFAEAQSDFEKNLQQRVTSIIGGFVRQRRAA